MQFKNIIKEESGVAYLLLIGIFLYIVVLGIYYQFMVDFMYFSLNAINIAFSANPIFIMDADSIYTGNLLIALLVYFLIPALPLLAYWVLNKSQKPEQPY